MEITLENLRAYARKLSARLDESCLPSLSIYMPQTKSQEKDGKPADFLCSDPTKNVYSASMPVSLSQLETITAVYQFMKNWETFHSLKSTIKKKQIEQFIRNKIATDDRWALRTLIIMYKHQTATEKQAEKTVENNRVGFTGWDSKLMTSFAKQYLGRVQSEKELDPRRLSKKQMDIIKKTMKKYWKQVYDNSDELKLLQQVAADLAKNGTQLSLDI